MFFFPLFDDNPTQRRPYVSWLIIAACIMVFFWQESLAAAHQREAIFQLGFIPANAFGIAPLPANFALLPAWMTIFTSMFLHGGWMHIGGNMLYLWIFGDNVEESIGRIKFIFFYALCGIAAALAQSAIDLTSRIPMIGASGGIAGILGAYLMLHPKAAIRTFVLIIVFVKFINLPAWIVLGIWIGGQFIAVPNALASDGGGVAYFAHIGGFAAGMILIPFFKRRDVPLFGRDDTPRQQWVGQPISFSTFKAEAHQRYRPSKMRDPLGSRRVSRPDSPTKGDSKTVEKAVRRSRHGSVPSVKRRPTEKRGPWG